MKFEKLFSPITIKGITFPNRIMRTSMVSRLAAEDGSVTEEIKDRYRREASGGVGSIVVEAAMILPSRSSRNLRISDDKFIPDLKELVNAIRDENSEVVVGVQIMSFLKVARSGWKQEVEDVTPEELKNKIEWHSEAARRAVEAGFDFVEFHNAHGFELASFLSVVNNRDDEYGGRLIQDRMRFSKEIYQGIRDKVGEDFLVGVRINGEDFTRPGTTVKQSRVIARKFAEWGADYVSVSAGDRFEDSTPPPGLPPFPSWGYSGARMSPKWWAPDGTNVYIAEQIRGFIREYGHKTPIAIAGKIRTPDLAEEILQKGQADFIGLCRPLVCDPDWPVKARAGREDDIVTCCACGYCNDLDGLYDLIKCILWQKDHLHSPSPFLLIPPCQGACPAGIDIEGYIQAALEGDYKRSLDIIKKKCPLPGVIGRVCTRPCESDCNRGEMDDPVAINAIKRFVVDEMEKRFGRKEIVPIPRSKKEKVAVIGSGPAGLTAAHDLAKEGYAVTIYEALSVAGGMMAVGIPEYRLPKDLLRDEIADIQNLGVEILLNTPVGKNGLSLEDLNNKYQAVFIAAGAHKSAKIGISNEDAKGVISGYYMLRDMNLDKEVKVGNKVVVIGGGNVAIDSARAALRLGAKEVSVVYRRSADEMPAIKDEIEAAEKEGVKFNYLSSPCKVVCEDDVCVGMECLQTELGEPDESGRRRPITVDGSEFVVDADTVISAIGEVPDLSFLKKDKFNVESDDRLIVNGNTMATNVDGIFAGGDVVSGPATVIEAIAAGHKAAYAINKYLRGESLDFKVDTPKLVNIEDVKIDDVRKQDRESMPCLSIDERSSNFKEVELGFDEDQAITEAGRCLDCRLRPKLPDMDKPES